MTPNMRCSEPVVALPLQSTCPAGRVAELGSFVNLAVSQFSDAKGRW